MEIYTIGFTKKSARAFFESLRRHGIERLVDVRINTTSQLAVVAANSLRAVFGPDLVRMSGTAAAVPQGSGNASLGVLRVRGADLVARTRYDRPDLRLHFTDPDFGDLRIKVTDLRLWEDDHVTPATVNIERIEGMLEDCFLAVGLTRAFQVSSYDGVWHWLQINNVFPVADPLWERE